MRDRITKERLKNQTQNHTPDINIKLIELENLLHDALVRLDIPRNTEVLNALQQAIKKIDALIRSGGKNA